MWREWRLQQQPSTPPSGGGIQAAAAVDKQSAQQLRKCLTWPDRLSPTIQVTMVCRWHQEVDGERPGHLLH